MSLNNLPINITHLRHRENEGLKIEFPMFVWESLHQFIHDSTAYLKIKLKKGGKQFQLIPDQTDSKELTNFISYERISVPINMKKNENQFKET